MKTFFKILGILVLAGILAAYLAFLFILPKKIDLNVYKEYVQKLALEQAHLNIDFKEPKIITTPALEAGLSLKDFSIKLPDGSELFSADALRTKISLPNLLLLTVRVSETVVENPKVNLEIAQDGSQFKVVRVVEDVINETKQKQETAPVVNSGFQFNPEWIKIKVPNIKISNYSVLINDLKSKHYLTLKGEELKAGYFHNKNFKVKTIAEFLSDENVNITANIALDSFIPPVKEPDEDDDPDYRADIAFVNPVLVYRDYDLKTDISSRLKVRMNKNGQIVLRGFADVENLTMNLSGYQLPESYFRAKFRPDTADLDTNLYVAPDQNIRMSGLIKYRNHPKLNLTINTGKIYFNNIIALSKAFMDTLHIKNDLNALSSSGYISANAKIKTNFKKLNSNGGIIVRGGKFANSSIGLLIRDINANILFKDKSLNIEDTYLYVNNSLLKVEGSINDKAVADISVFADKLPLPGLFAAFAPVEAKKAFNITSGNLLLKLKLTGELKKALSTINAELSDFDLSTKDNSLRIFNENFKTTFSTDFKTLSANIADKNLKIFIPASNSVISNPKLDVIVDEENITLNPADIQINNESIVNISGNIIRYMKKPEITLNADGRLSATDLKQLLGKEAAPFINARGKIPVKFKLTGNDKKQNMTCQLKSDKINYITPVDIESVKGLQSIIQAKLTFKGDRINIKDTGLYTKITPTPFTDDLDANMEGVRGVAVISGTISKLDTPTPFINRINIQIPKDLKMQICAFKNSSMTLGGKLIVFGQALSPKYNGKFYINDLTIPDLFLTLKNTGLNFSGKNLIFNADNVVANGSDFNVKGTASLIPSPVFVINNLNVTSNNIEVEKLLAVSEAAMKYAPPANPNAKPADIPVRISDGTINLKRILSPPLLIADTTGRISLRDNIFYLNNLNTHTLGGNIVGRVSANLLSMLIKANINGTNFDVEKTFLEVMNMKDTLSGTMAFVTDLEINGAAKTQEEQMKGVKGSVDFVILKGQLGPFGKLENLILAENIRESQFFQTALGGVINSLTSIQTSHFDVLKGHILMDNGVAQLKPITSVGPVMCMHIDGEMNLLTNKADMKLRARLGSQIANMLGPIAAVNPINLVKATPGLNVAAAKMFAFFCEEVTQAEMDAIPNFKEEFGKMSTTNFQIVLRGDVAKPLSLIKSFKWLATVGEINSATEFINTLPPPDAANPNATLEEILAAQEEAERIKNENIFQKGIRKIKGFIGKYKKDKTTI